MISKILIANRGEIACRVIRTARRMGIATVAVYSEADARAPHVLMADEAVLLGPPPASQSYLLADAIIAACKATGADAVHPGYGFLSERESFARACAENDIVFIGPPPNAIAAMGDKIESKKLALAAGVNVVPGHVGEIDDTDHAVRIAGEIGYPVMMKASAGGGGKGMRLAYSEAEVREGFPAVKREGLASFGDDRVFIEKFIEQPRHIEIQVLGDQHGNILYLGERECSIQRRHQKVIEEAPSPFVTPDMRRAMGEQAVALARAVGYYSAGTVELIVSGADRTGESFYFLEMNTRLQVEHPVTEMVTGLDLVEQMIRVANGEALGFTQADVRLDGWAVESRVYAEDPYRGFLPSTGRLVRYTRPETGVVEADADELDDTELEAVAGQDAARGGEIRLDDGVAEGSDVSMFYDPMIAKLVTHAPTRTGAIDLQIDALDRFEIEGLNHNIDFLSALMQHERFRAGDITTAFIATEYPDGFAGAPAAPGLRRRLAAIAAFVSMAQADRARRIDGQLARPLAPPTEWQVRIGDEDHAVTIHGDDLTVDGAPLFMALDYTPGDRLVEAEFGTDDAEEGLAVRIAPVRAGWRLTTRGASHEARVLPAHVARHADHMIEHPAPDLSRFLMSPMPGRLVALHVEEGDKVEAGQPLAVVEAMKMENVLRAGKAGTVASIVALSGATLALDDVILELE
ncbi:acetyl-CoA carboxylase biotin carboxylase subunit [Sphingobium lignivorans]|uniref:propionyl-CoA carboxylase n=1 Tax=Sphingobium lignivorans TaxID=2735886 RepID=A0ABR6NGH2_9SPHN|nr:acetyl/propionyl/methylcrotonyl-CoA carboxylase subunit alpha [Sphingobium lignivorans]MBB5986380.1 propionyl-CoA carboxylase alpha chain [Sphingobium lignivorans]